MLDDQLKQAQERILTLEKQNGQLAEQLEAMRGFANSMYSLAGEDPWRRREAQRRLVTAGLNIFTPNPTHKE